MSSKTRRLAAGTGIFDPAATATKETHHRWQCGEPVAVGGSRRICDSATATIDRHRGRTATR